MRSFRHCLFWVAAGLLLMQSSGWACSVCYGEPDAPMSRGLTWAVVVLAGMISLVLVGVAGFFVHVNRRSQQVAAAKPDANLDR